MKCPIPKPVKWHPLGLMAMWGWVLLGLSLAIPSFMDDPKPWPDLLWPARLDPADVAESYGMGVLAVGMVLSGSLFIVSQVCLNGRWRWPEFTRWVALWMATVVGAYTMVSIMLKAATEPSEMAPWWPASVLTWLVTTTLLVIAMRRSLYAAKGETFYRRHRCGETHGC